ncbi:MAG: helix-turn-helix domain-containing protein, partial [Hydrogenophaga sp.]
EKRFAPEALAKLAAYTWPGNVRELRNAVHRAYVMAPGETIDTQWLPDPGEGFVEASAVPPPAAPPAAAPSREPGGDTVVLPLGISLAEAERQLILSTLEHYDRQKERTAAALGISLKTLYNRLKQYAADDKAGR